MYAVYLKQTRKMFLRFYVFHVFSFFLSFFAPRTFLTFKSMERTSKEHRSDPTPSPFFRINRSLDRVVIKQIRFYRGRFVRAFVLARPTFVGEFIGGCRKSFV